MSDQQRWLAHLTAQAHHADALSALPADLPGMVTAIQGVVVHADWALAYGIDEASSRQTLSVPDRLDDIIRRNPAPVDRARPPAQRSTGTCRDFALLLCASLRHQAVPARMRCGFAAYFDPPWEDHWLCEYWHKPTGSWRLADAQIDAMLRDRLAIDFDVTNVPRKLFRTAGEAWLSCREGKDDALRFGHGAVTGLWFIAVNVIRDHLALNGRHTSAWDRWREAPDAMRQVRDQDLIWFDSLAGEPDQPPTAKQPDWLA